MPPDAYTDKGQLWGNPLYDWPALRRRGYRWWVERLRRTFELFDLARIDHFRGFVAYWAVPRGARYALRGSLAARPRARRCSTRRAAALGDAAADRRGPRRDHAGGRAAARLARASRDGVLQFGFDAGEPRRRTASSNHAENRIVYTGTHDNDTRARLVRVAGRATRARVDAALAAPRHRRAPSRGGR